MNSKRAALITCLTLAAWLPSIAGAAPLTLTITGAEWDLGTGWGDACTSSSCDSSHNQLNVSWSIDPSLVGTDLTFNNVNDSRTVTIGKAFFSEEDRSIAAAEVDDLALSGKLKLASLDTDPVITAATTARTGSLRDHGDNASNNQDLAVSFSDIEVALASGARIKVHFPTVSWICEGNKSCTYEGNANIASNDIMATFTLTQAAADAPVRAAATSIPEPASLWLAGLGLLGLGAGRRRLQARG